MGRRTSRRKRPSLGRAGSFLYKIAGAVHDSSGGGREEGGVQALVVLSLYFRGGGGAKMKGQAQP